VKHSPRQRDRYGFIGRISSEDIVDSILGVAVRNVLEQTGRRGTQFRWSDPFDEGGGIDWKGNKNSIYLNWHNGPHEGTDLLMAWGTPVVAAAPGEVKYVDDWDSEGWPGQGTFLIVSYEDEIEPSESNPTSTLYAHLSKVTIRQLKRVSGLSGGTGLNHLHFELDVGFHGSPLRGSPYRDFRPRVSRRRNHRGQARPDAGHRDE
jgi:murein DD-endopeptidase MepM/ murein hydrolase activator NlpD